MDTDSFLSEFILESDRLIQDALVMIKLVSQDQGNREKLHSLFRNIHSIKGVSGFVKQDDIKEVCHKFETELDNIRTDKIELTEERSRLIEVILRYIRDIVHACEQKDDNYYNLYKNILRLISSLHTGDIKESDVIYGATPVFIPFSKKINSDVVDSLYVYRRKIKKNETTIAELLPEFQEIEVIISNLMKASEESHYKIYNLSTSLDLFIDYLKKQPGDQKEPCEVLAKNLELLNSLISLEFMGIKNLSLDTSHYVRQIQSEISKKEPEVASKIVIPSLDSVGFFKQFQNQSFTVRVGPEKLSELNDFINEITLSRNLMIELTDKITAENGLKEHTDSISNITDRLTVTEESLRSFYFDIKKVPMMALYQRLDMLINQISEQLRKKIYFERIGESILLSQNKLEILKESLFHIVRNSCDHGIEIPEERVAAGKSEFGTINIGAEDDSDELVICIKDDGRGLDPDKIRAKLLKTEIVTKKELKNKTDQELFEYLFLPGVTTSEKVTEISGRGVGLDVVKSNLKRLKGSIKIDSKLGEFTEFTISIPS